MIPKYIVSFDSFPHFLSARNKKKFSLKPFANLNAKIPFTFLLNIAQRKHSQTNALENGINLFDKHLFKLAKTFSSIKLAYHNKISVFDA